MSAFTEPDYAPAAPRLDLYAAIHKSLRLFMGDTLARLGRLDIDHSVELDATLTQLDQLLSLCQQHLQHENQFLHTAIEARSPGASSRIEGEHLQHLDTLAALAADAAALRAQPSAAAAHRLYRLFALFVAENFSHMNVEETAHNQALWSTYSDDELLALHQRLLAAITPAEMATVLRWMVPALNPVERAALLAAMQPQLPPEGVRGLLASARAQLDDTAWAKLAQALAAPPVPGLVTA